MASEKHNTLNKALRSLPTRDEIRRRITENMQERQVLRRMLKLVERPLPKGGRR